MIGWLTAGGPRGWAHEELIETTPEGYQYAVKLPDGYRESKGKVPVLFCFHDRGDGVETTRVFGYAWSRLNWIIVGFIDLTFTDLNVDVWKNALAESQQLSKEMYGESWKEIIKVQDAVLADVKRKYRVDTNRYYAAGFLKGATMALKLAYRYPFQFKGVIAMGGDSEHAQAPRSVGVYYLVAEDDYKNIDVKREYNSLKANHIPTQLMIYKGERDWPSREQIDDALKWISQKK